MLSIYLKELRSLYTGFVGYLTVGGFFVVIGLVLWVFPEYNILDSGYASLNNFFELVPYVFLMVIPPITMGSFAEEKKSGTILLLQSSPLREYEIVLGKFLASVTLIGVIIFNSLIYYAILYCISSPVGNLDHGAIVGAYVGIAFLGVLFCAASLFFASFGEKQVVCYFLGSLFCCFLYQGLNSLSEIFSWSPSSLWILKFGSKSHYESISKGVLLAKDLGYFMFVTILFLELTFISLKKYKR